MSDVSELNEPVPDQQGTDGPSTEDSGHQSFRLEDQRVEALEAAQRAVRAGKCIVMPTDTVYGIGADAFSAQAVQRLLDAKHRGRDMPPPVLIAEPAMLPALVAYVPINARALIDRFWPGALTLILRAQSSLHLDLGDTDGTIAVRVPDDDATRELLRHTGPLAVSSANVSGSPSATDVDEAEAMLGDSVEVYLDGGPTPGPVASTIVDFTQNPSGRILRQGVIPFEELRELSSGLEDQPAPEPARTEATPEGEATAGSEATPEGDATSVAEGSSAESSADEASAAPGTPATQTSATEPQTPATGTPATETQTPAAEDSGHPGDTRPGA